MSQNSLSSGFGTGCGCVLGVVAALMLVSVVGIALMAGGVIGIGQLSKNADETFKRVSPTSRTPFVTPATRPLHLPK
jgi:hypothetical protein